VSHPIVADRSKLAAVCIDMGSVVVDERLTWARWQSQAIKHLKRRGIVVSVPQLRQAVRAAMLSHAPRASGHALGALLRTRASARRSGKMSATSTGRWRTPVRRSSDCLLGTH